MSWQPESKGSISLRKRTSVGKQISFKLFLPSGYFMILDIQEQIRNPSRRIKCGGGGVRALLIRSLTHTLEFKSPKEVRTWGSKILEAVKKRMVGLKKFYKITVYIQFTWFHHQTIHNGKKQTPRQVQAIPDLNSFGFMTVWTYYTLSRNFTLKF